jgi:hypothetical protein
MRLRRTTYRHKTIPFKVEEISLPNSRYQCNVIWNMGFRR